PDDQRPDEAFSLVFTWPALEREVEILGHARLAVTIASSAPIAYLSAKLCDVFPDGASSLVSRGMLNLAHRDSREDPSPLEPGRTYQVSFELDAASWTFEAGHRIRLDLAGTDWPNAWPPPEPVALTIDRSSATITLPVLDGPSPVTGRPTLAPPHRDDEHPGEYVWRIEHDVPSGQTRAITGYGGDSTPHDDIPAFSERYDGTVTVSRVDPGDASARGEAWYELRWPEATCASRATLDIHSTREAYHVHIDLSVTENGEERWHRVWDRTISRDHQ
ncbi:MAG: CocE/NonD family hydrolase C-terminal non-catalytic domain-containing protein, partial [Actinomycetota bacterium]